MHGAVFLGMVVLARNFDRDMCFGRRTNTHASDQRRIYPNAAALATGHAALGEIGSTQVGWIPAFMFDQRGSCLHRG